ncbi:MAG: hypothetical protein L0H94_14120 [Nitrospira sp.]|nr:hypothetical protein [Nitrospira sp.]
MKTQTNILVNTARLVVVVGMGLTLMSFGEGVTNSALAQQDTGRDFVAPTVFQAAGPNLASIQNTVEEYRTALGGQNNGIAPGPIADGRREIGWDAGGSTATTVTGTPLIDFREARGALFTTPGTGFVQAPLDGLVTIFNNQTYDTIFQPFSLQRLFSAINSNVTETTFFVPGPDNNNNLATTKGFGAVFTDVDLPDGSGPRHKRRIRKASTLVEYFGADRELLFSSFVPASPGDKSLSFFGIVFNDARIAKVRITSGDEMPGPNDDARNDIVMMDDFIYAEPQRIR